MGTTTYYALGDQTLALPRQLRRLYLCAHDRAPLSHTTTGRPWIQYLYRKHWSNHNLTWLQGGSQNDRGTKAYNQSQASFGAPGAANALRRCYVWRHHILRPNDDESGAGSRRHPRSSSTDARTSIDWNNLSSEHGIFRSHVPKSSRPLALSPEALLGKLEKT
jgi:hypothetical protein